MIDYNNIKYGIKLRITHLEYHMDNEIYNIQLFNDVGSGENRCIIVDLDNFEVLRSFFDIKDFLSKCIILDIIK